MKRVLQVVGGGMVLGGVESWLMHVLRSIDRRRFRLDFLVDSDRPGLYDDEIRALGSSLYFCGAHRSCAYAPRVIRLLRERGPFDAVHSHVQNFSGVVLRLAAHAGVPLRIAHSHNDLSAVDAGAGLLRSGYLALSRRWIRSYATVGLAGSGLAAANLYGTAWEKEPKWRILPYGLDFGPFEAPPDRVEVRRGLGIPEGALVVGHVGRMVGQKNQAFLLDVMAELAKAEPEAAALLVGDGPLRENLRRQAARLGMERRVFFAGARPDCARMMGAMDVFLFPSLYEGLPLALLQAQAAGVPCLVSDAITAEADEVGPLVRRLSLRDGAGRWAREAADLVKKPPAVTKGEALERMKRSVFDIASSVAAIESLYETGRFPEAT